MEPFISDKYSKSINKTYVKAPQVFLYITLDDMALHHEDPGEGSIRLVGIADACTKNNGVIDRDNVWEIKCRRQTLNFRIYEKVQLMLYVLAYRTKKATLIEFHNGKFDTHVFTRTQALELYDRVKKRLKCMCEYTNTYTIPELVAFCER